jgi:hypothetical protein
MTLTVRMKDPVLQSRSRIILIEPELQRELGPATMAPALKLMFNIGGLSKMTQTKPVSHFFYSISYPFK